MEEKKFPKSDSPFRSFLGFGHNNQSFLGKSDSSKPWRFLGILDGNKGFTLIEMIVVIGILGILATAAIASLNPFVQFQKANDAKRKTDLSQIQKALETYYQDFQRYPTSTNDQITGVAWGQAWQPYMNVLPKDPSSPSKNYVYSVINNGQSYYIYASLDRISSSDQCIGADPCGTAKCGGTCNFGVSSPDVKP